MAQVVGTLATAEVQEVAGDTFSKVATGPVKVIWKPGYSKIAGALQVEDVTIDFRLDTTNGPYRKIDSRTFCFSTEDIMNFYYVVFDKGTSEHELAKAELVFKQLALRNKPVIPEDPVPGAREADAVIAEAVAHDSEVPPAAHPAPNPLGQVGGFLQGLAKRAAEDTAILHEIAQKAGADTLLLAGQGAAAVSSALQPKPAAAHGAMADPKPEAAHGEMADAEPSPAPA